MVNIGFAEGTLHCPEDFGVASDKGLSYASNVTWSAPVIDGYDMPLDLVSNRLPGDSFYIGTHTIIYSVSLGSFQTECNFTLSIYGKYITSRFLKTNIETA